MSHSLNPLLSSIHLSLSCAHPVMPSETPAPLEITPALLVGFEPERILSESTMTGSTFIFGTLAGQQAIIHVQKTVVVGKDAEDALKLLENVKLLLENAPVNISAQLFPFYTV